MAFDAAVHWEAGAGFEAGDIAFFDGGRVFPQCQIGKLVEMPAHGDGAIGGGVVKHHHGAAGEIGGGNDAIDLFDETFCWAGVGFECGNGFGGIGVEGRDLFVGADEFGIGLEQRRAVIGVIDHLEFLIVRAEVVHSIFDAEFVGAGFGGDIGPEFEFRTVEHAFVHATANVNAFGRGGIDKDLNFAGRNVADFAVKREIHFGFVAGVGDEFVFAGMAGEFESATDDEFVETFEPTEPAAALEIDVLRVDDFFDG